MLKDPAEANYGRSITKDMVSKLVKYTVVNYLTIICNHQTY